MNDTHSTLYIAHQSLDHVYSLVPHSCQELIHIDTGLGHDPLQHGVQENEGSGTTHSCTAVDQHVGLGIVVLTESTDESNESRCKLGYSVIWPTQELEMVDFQWRNIGHPSLHTDITNTLAPAMSIHDEARGASVPWTVAVFSLLDLCHQQGILTNQI